MHLEAETAAVPNRQTAPTTSSNTSQSSSNAGRPIDPNAIAALPPGHARNRHFIETPGHLARNSTTVGWGLVIDQPVRN